MVQRIDIMPKEEFHKLTTTIPQYLYEGLRLVSKKQRRSIGAQLAVWIEEKLEELEDEYDAMLIDEWESNPNKEYVSKEEFLAHLENGS